MNVPSTSRAAVVHAYGGPDLITVQSRPTPTAGPGEVLVAIRAAGVNLVDTMLRDGYLKTGPLPLTLGCDFAGVVADAGEGGDFATGDEVYGYKLLGNGTYAEYAAVDASLIARKPPSLSFAAAAALPCAGLIAYDAIVNTLALKPGESILVAGASGGVGHLAVQIAKARGATVIATASKRNLQFVRSLGADHALDYNQNLATAIRELLPNGVDVALPTVREAERSALAVTRDGGRITWINNAFDLPLDRGITGTETNGSHGRALLDALSNLVQGGAIPTIHIEHQYRLADAAQAHIDVAHGRVRGKLVINTTT